MKLQVNQSLPVLYLSKVAHFSVLIPSVIWDFLVSALQSLWGQGDYQQEMDEMLTEQAAIEAAPPVSLLQLLRDRTVRWQVITISTIYCCNQLSGMSTVWTIPYSISIIPYDTIWYRIAKLQNDTTLQQFCDFWRFTHMHTWYICITTDQYIYWYLYIWDFIVPSISSFYQQNRLIYKSDFMLTVYSLIVPLFFPD